MHLVNGMKQHMQLELFIIIISLFLFDLTCFRFQPVDFCAWVPPLQVVRQPLLEGELGTDPVDLRGLPRGLRRILLLPRLQHGRILKNHHRESRPSAMAGNGHLRETGTSTSRRAAELALIQFMPVVPCRLNFQTFFSFDLFYSYRN